MSDMDILSDGNFDIESDSSLDSDLDLYMDSDIESLDSFDDVDASFLGDGDSNMDLDSTGSDFFNESFDEVGLQADIDEASDSSEDLLSDLDEVPDTENFESISEVDIDTSDDEIEILEMDDGELIDEVGTAFEADDETEEVSGEQIDLLDTNDYLSDVADDIQEEAGLISDETETLSENISGGLDLEDGLESLSLEDLTDLEYENGNEELEELVSPAEEEMTETPEDALDAIQAERERLTEIKEALAEMQNSEIKDADEYEEDSPMVRTREITSEILESRERDTEEVLDNYRDNLRGYGVNEAQIEEFVEQEREKINAEYESLDRGDEYPQMYETPNDWEKISASLMGQETQDEIHYESSQFSEIENQALEELEEENQELEINYDEIYEAIQQDSLEQGFENIQVDADPERLNQSLENFNESTWEDLTLDEQKDSMASLADYVVDVIGFENPPKIEYYNNERKGDFGGYDSTANTLYINEYMLYNSDEAADTIAHELWHAHQHECAENPQSALDYQYQYNFENYIPPELGQEEYESQLVEAEARAFAAQFKDRLSHINRGHDDG